MALALSLFLLLLLAVALPARAAQAAPLQAWQADRDGYMDFLDALSDDGLKPLENAEGKFSCPPTGKNEDTGDKKSLEAAKHLDQMLSDLERCREMKRKAVLKAALPIESRGSLAASPAGREAIPGTVSGDESARMALPAAWMEDGLETLGASAGVSGGRTFPGPLVDVANKPSSHRRGPLRGRKKTRKQNKSLEESKELEQILSDLERRREMEQKALLKAAYPAGSNGPMPETATGSKEMPDSATEDIVTEAGIYAPDPVRLPRIVCPQDVRRSCMIGTVVTVLTVPLVLIVCYLGIHKLYEIRRSV
ncbi:unnamed protein product, partial [Coccothraustes coccothraustes]